MACAKTVVSEDKDMFLGELSISYLSAAPTSVSNNVLFELMFRIFQIREDYNCVRFCRLSWWWRDQW